MSTNPFNQYKLPYHHSKEYSESVAYFSMEFAVDQSLKIFSGGLGFLAGSHMRSAYELKQNIIGIGILWKYGYYDQVRTTDNKMDVLFQQKSYNFLKDTGIKFQLEISDHMVWVKAMYLEPDIFGCAPLFLLTTDLPENDYLSRTICHHLYDSNTETKIAQSILLGVGGAKLLDELSHTTDVFHLNEAHGLPAAFYLYDQSRNLEAVRQKMVFTTHTPVSAGNEKHNIDQLNKMSFFLNLPLEEVRSITGTEKEVFDHTLTALRMSRKANGVSEVHGQVARKMWGEYTDIAPIISITNSQNKKYWADEALEISKNNRDIHGLIDRKHELKRQLFEVVADQTGKRFDPKKLTIIWARRFAGYKRADLITRDIELFEKICCNSDMPVQIIWAGKPYPKDTSAIDMFNKLVEFCSGYPNIAILTGYEMHLSKQLKQGGDVWLNNPRIPQEASGTSGMTAALNGCVNLSTWDGWVPEFIEHGKNGFTVPAVDFNNLTEKEQDETDMRNLLSVIEQEIAPLYYKKPASWARIILKAMNMIVPEFESGRMADEYYKKLYARK